jgi:hypothetical protein
MRVSLGSSSRVRGTAATEILGWAPPAPFDHGMDRARVGVMLPFRYYTNCSRNSRPTIFAARCRLSIVALPLSGSSRRSI